MSDVKPGDVLMKDLKDGYKVLRVVRETNSLGDFTVSEFWVNSDGKVFSINPDSYCGKETLVEHVRLVPETAQPAEVTA